MKAEVAEQRSILELTGLDAELLRLAHRATHLPEQQRLDAIGVEQQEANDRLAVLGLVLDDLDGQVAKFEAEVDGVRQREDRDRGLLAGGHTDHKQLVELQHELETLERRQSSLEDSLLEVMERREQVQEEQTAQLVRIDELQSELSAVQATRDEALVAIEQEKHRGASRRDQLTSGMDADLLALYERVRTKGGIGAGLLQGRRCGACRIEIDKGELARISLAPDDDVLRCPECGAILLRLKDSGQ
jgi:predicted  nucleic acid-binding Zn-ribbon protein